MYVEFDDYMLEVRLNIIRFVLVNSTKYDRVILDYTHVHHILIIYSM